MPKRIVVCSDGTGNTAIKGRGTNVFKLYEAVDENGHRFDASLIAAAYLRYASLFAPCRLALDLRRHSLRY